jgi:hypothetical protein
LTYSALLGGAVAADIPDDIQRLRDQFTGWTFGTAWATAASGPDRRRIWAMRDGFLLSAWTAAELAAEIRRQEACQ